MGQIPNADYILGNDCTVCDGIILPWSDYGTPKYIEAVFSGLTQCPVAGWGKNGSFLMTQDLVGPCKWAFDDGEFHVEYLPNAFVVPDREATLLQIHAIDNVNAFWGFAPKCTFEFTNDFVLGSCNGVWINSYGGTGIVRWGPGIKP